MSSLCPSQRLPEADLEWKSSSARGKGRASASSTTPAASAKSKPTTTGGKQMTLFGLPPGKEPEKKTKKRKSAADDGEEGAATTTDSTASSSNKKLEAFRKKPGTAATAGLGAEAARELPREDEEMEETQIVDETQQDEESLPAPPAKRRDSELEAVREEQEEEAEDTQMSETQVETQVEEDPVHSRREPALRRPLTHLDSAGIAQGKHAPSVVRRT